MFEEGVDRQWASAACESERGSDWLPQIQGEWDVYPG